MRFRRPRFTTRWLMIAVASVGMVLGLVNLGDRREFYRRQVLLHLVLEHLHRNDHHHGPADPTRAAFHHSLRRKYERAMARTWMTIEPDPPEPHRDRPEPPMRFSRLRVGIRWLMVAVAIAAGMMGWRQHQVYQ